jgi:hypothetical protein
MRRAISLRESLYGEDSPALAGDLLGLVRVLRGLGELDAAKTNLARAERLSGLRPSQQASLQRERSALQREEATLDQASGQTAPDGETPSSQPRDAALRSPSSEDAEDVGGDAPTNDPMRHAQGHRL